MLNNLLLTSIVVKQMLSVLPNKDEIPTNIVDLLSDVIEAGIYDNEYFLSDKITILMSRAHEMRITDVESKTYCRAIAGFLNSSGHRKNLWLSILMYLPKAQDFFSHLQMEDMIGLSNIFIRNAFRLYPASNVAFSLIPHLIQNVPQSHLSLQLQVIEDNRVLCGISEEFYTLLRMQHPSLPLPLTLFADDVMNTPH